MTEKQNPVRNHELAPQGWKKKNYSKMGLRLLSFYVHISFPFFWLHPRWYIRGRIHIPTRRFASSGGVMWWGCPTWPGWMGGGLEPEGNPRIHHWVWWVYIYIYLCVYISVDNICVTHKITIYIYIYMFIHLYTTHFLVSLGLVYCWVHHI